MYHAVKSDFENVKEIFYLHKKWFPHVRTDYMKRMIAKKNLILDNNVVITYNIYKRKQKIGDVQALKGDCILHQIVAKTKGTASDVLQRFFKFVNRRVYLSVRSDNDIAKNFYLRNNMKLVGKTSWAKDTLPGDVFVHNKSFDWSTEKW